MKSEIGRMSIRGVSAQAEKELSRRMRISEASEGIAEGHWSMDRARRGVMFWASSVGV